MSKIKFETVVLNLDSRQDRLIEVTAELEKQGLPFSRFSAISHEIGLVGYNKSIRAIFEKYKNVEHLLLIEDDCYFEQDFDRSVLDDLPEDYDGLWLGSNLQARHRKRYGKRMYILENGWNTHACLFSKQFRDWVLYTWDGELVIDEWVRVNALPIRKCFVLSPMIAFQRISYSDIQKSIGDYTQAWEWAKQKLM